MTAFDAPSLTSISTSPSGRASTKPKTDEPTSATAPGSTTAQAMFVVTVTSMFDAVRMQRPSFA